jgi:hypothetical protein
MTSGATAGGETAAANWPSSETAGGESAAAKRHRLCCTLVQFLNMFLRIFTVLIKSSECYWKHL